MEFSSSICSFSIPKSLLNIRKIPDATEFLLASCIIYNAVLWIIKYNKGGIALPSLELVPSKIIWRPTSLVLANFVDSKLLKFFVNVINLVIGGSFIERNWQSGYEMFKFILLIGSLTNLFIVIVTYALSFMFSSIDLDVPIDGNYSILIGFPIIYRQLLPETTIINIKYPTLLATNFRFKMLPMLVMFTMTATQLIWFHHFAQLLSIWITFFACWIYLRFYQRLPSPITDGTIIVGDASETFQLIYFFPNWTRPALTPIFDHVYNLICVKLRIIKPFEEVDIDTGNHVAEHRGAKKSNNNTSERRRELALKILQERMEEP